MTNEQRDVIIRETHDSVIRMEDRVLEHEKILKGNGNPGVVRDVVTLKLFKNASCWFFGAIVLACITVIGKLIYNHLVG